MKSTIKRKKNIVEYPWILEHTEMGVVALFVDKDQGIILSDEGNTHVIGGIYNFKNLRDGWKSFRDEATLSNNPVGIVGKLALKGS